jgi:MFS family permease
MSLYLQYIKGLPPQSAGSILVAQPIVMTIFSPLAGRWSDRIEPRLLASAGMAILAAGLAFASFIDSNTGMPWIVAVLLLFGFGFALFSSPNTNAVMGSVEKKHYSVASAALGTMRLTGQMLSMGIVMLIFSLHIGRVKIVPANYPLFLVSLRTIFWIFAILSLIGVFFSLARGSLHSRVGK